MKTGIYRNAVAIPAGAIHPAWIRIVPVAHFPNHPDGAHEVTAEAVRQMAVNFSATATDLLFDLDHRSVFTDDTRAVGWSNKVEARADGLYAMYPVWTNYGKPIIEGREYRYLSPVYVLHGKGKQGQPIGARILSVGVTNIPYMNEGEIDAISNGGRSKPAQKRGSRIEDRVSEDAMNYVLNGLAGFYGPVSDR